MISKKDRARVGKSMWISFGYRPDTGVENIVIEAAKPAALKCGFKALKRLGVKLSKGGRRGR